MKRINIRLLLVTLFAILVIGNYFPAQEALAKNDEPKSVQITPLKSRSKRKAKTEVIQNRKQLINSFTKHIINYDKNFSYKISKNALKNFGKDFDRLLDEFTDNPAYNEMRKYSEIDYDYKKSGGFLYLDVKVKYTISKDKAKKILKKSDKKIIKSRSELMKKYTSHILKMDKTFHFNVSKDLLAYSYEDINDFLKELTKNPAFNDIMEHVEISEDHEFFYEYLNYWEWTITPNYKISKEKGKKILEQSSPVLNSEQEIVDRMVSHVTKLDRKFALNISTSALDFDNDAQYDKLWEKLYEVPEFSDITRYEKSFSSDLYDYNGYTKWVINYEYDLQQKEIDDLNNFVSSWVSRNISSSMTEEEKVRAINDYMVNEYRYSFGDKGEQFPGSPDYNNEKIGKHSVYTCFALLYEKGGVCDAKAKMFYRLAREAGLEVLYTTGDVNAGLHAWNMVKVDGKWYHLDNTWNRGSYEGQSEYEYYNSRDYYLKSDSTMSRDHRWDRSKYPAAYEDYPLYNIPTSQINTYLKQAA